MRDPSLHNRDMIGPTEEGIKADVRVMKMYFDNLRRGCPQV